MNMMDCSIIDIGTENRLATGIDINRNANWVRKMSFNDEYNFEFNSTVSVEGDKFVVSGININSNSNIPIILNPIVINNDNKIG